MKKKSEDKDLAKDDKSDKLDKSSEKVKSKKENKTSKIEKAEPNKDDKNIDNSIEIDKSGKDTEKALFIQRLFAFFIDVLVVSFIASLFATPFIDSKRSEDYEAQLSNVYEKYMQQETSADEFVIEYSNIAYNLARNNGIVSIVTIVVGILYYVVFQLYNNGSTLGKKLLKIRVVSTNGDDLSMNQLIFRSFIANSILLDILSIIFVIFAKRDTYFYCVGLFSMIQYIIVIISLFMVMYSKDGLSVHDRLVHTKVIKIK